MNTLFATPEREAPPLFVLVVEGWAVAATLVPALLAKFL